MPVLEIIQLKLAPGVSPDEPSLVPNISNVRTALRERVYNTNSRCYQSIENPTVILIFGIWPDLETHEAFLKSPLRPEILALQQGQTKFSWMLHFEFDDINTLPFDAPVMSFERFHVKGGDHVTSHTKSLEKTKGLLEDATKPYNVVEAWRIDSEPGKHESIVISGWESIETHVAFQDKLIADNPELASAREHYEDIEALHARNMER